MTDTTILYGMQPEPSTRGTFSIVSSCFVTLSLCLWASLPLNIPKHGRPIWRTITQKVGWVMCGLLAPELIACLAAQQLHEARELTHQMQLHLEGRQQRPWRERLGNWLCCLRPKDYHEQARLNPDEAEASMPNDRHPQRRRRHHRWTLAHSYRTLTGGFVFDAGFTQPPSASSSSSSSTDPKRYYAANRTTLLALARAEPHLIPDISAGEARSGNSNNNSNTRRRKGGGVSASSWGLLFVLAQGAVFGLHCAGRARQGLPLSLLEIATCARALVALASAALSRQRPRREGLQSPTLFGGGSTSGECDELCAAIMVREAYRRRGYCVGVLDSDSAGEPRFVRRARIKLDLRSHRHLLSAKFRYSASVALDLTGHWFNSLPDKSASYDNSYVPGDTIGDFQLLEPERAEVYPDGFALRLASADVSFLELASRGLRRYGEFFADLEAEEDPGVMPPSPTLPPHAANNDDDDNDDDNRGRPRQQQRPRSYDRAGVRPRRGERRPGLSKAAVAALLGTGALCGAAHFAEAAWPLASGREAARWRAAAAVLVLSGLVDYRVLRTWEVYALPVQSRYSLAEYVLTVVAALMSLAVRVYVVVEAFRQLHHLPAAAFETPAWTRYWLIRG